MDPRSRIFLILIVMMLLAQPFVLPALAQGNGPDITVMTPSPDSINLQLPLTDDVTLKFYTNVTLNDPDDLQVEADLTVTNFKGWTATVSPDHMSFKTTGKQAAIIMVVVPKTEMDGTNTQIHLLVFATFPDGSTEASTATWVHLIQYCALQVTYQYMKKTQFDNRIEFGVTNTGTGTDYYTSIWVKDYGANLEVIFNKGDSWFTPRQLEPNETDKVEMTAKYLGSSYPEEYIIQIRFTSSQAHNQGSDPYYWDVSVPVSFVAPDRTQQNYLFAGVVSAAVIIMVVVMAAIVFGSRQKK